jgi:hypothetical protein
MRAKKVSLGCLGLLVFLVVLGLIVGPKKKPQSISQTVPKAESSTSPITDQTGPVASATGKWEVSKGVSRMDDSPLVVISLDAENNIKGWIQAARPSLVFRCKEGKTEGYIDVGMSPNPEYGKFDEFTVRARFEGESEPWTFTMSGSTDGKALFFTQPIRELKYMLDKKSMVFEFTPFRANPVLVEFDLQGVSAASKSLREACRW